MMKVDEMDTKRIYKKDRRPRRKELSPETKMSKSIQYGENKRDT